MKIFTKHFILFILTLYSISIIAQSGSNDSTFNVLNNCLYGDGSNTTGQVNTIAIQTDGKVVIGGSFTTFNGTSRNRIARLNTDGSLDVSFNASGQTGISIVLIQNDGKILAGGSSGVARYNTDGTADASFVGGSSNSIVYSMQIQTDGKIVVGGNFTIISGTSRNYIARLNTDGTIDASFNPGTGFNNIVRTLAIQPDGKIITGGDFTSFNGTGRNYIARLNTNGTLDTGFNTGTGFNAGTGGYGTVISISIQTDGAIVVGGDFTTFNGVSCIRLVRLNSTGTLDSSFNPGTRLNGPVLTTCIQPDGKIFAGGVFNSFGGFPSNYIVRYNTNGTFDNVFNTGTGAGFDQILYSICLQTDGKVLVGGTYSNFNNYPKRRIARLNTDGTLDFSFGGATGFNGTVESVAIQTNGKILVGGDFDIFNDSIRNNIARLNIDGSLDSTFNPGIGTNLSIKSIAILSTGNILIGGNFSTVSGTARNKIARLNSNGSLDNFFNPGTGFVGNVISISIQSNNSIIVGGSFTSFNGTTRNNIVRLSSNGTLDGTFNPGTGFNSGVNSTAIQTNGKILVGGDFTTFNGVSSNKMVRLNTDGTLDATFNIGTGFNGAVQSIQIQTDGKILVAGNFTTFNGITKNRIVRLNIDGTLDSSFNPGTGFNGLVFCIKLQTDGMVVAIGNFTTFNGITNNRIARILPNGSLDATFTSGIGFGPGSATTMAIQSDGKILVGGGFNYYNGVCRNRIARLNVCTNPIRTDNIISCGPYTWIDGITYTSTNNTATFTLLNPSGCDSIISLNLTVNAIPVAPYGNSPQVFCVSGTTISSLSVGGSIGSTIQWYSTATGGLPLSSSTALVNGSTYYASQTVNNCESTSRLAVTVSIIITPTPTGTSTQTFCTGATLASLVANGTTIKWYSSAIGGTQLNINTPLVNGSIYYASQTVSGCESTSRLSVTVNITNSPAPSGSTNQIHCTGSTVANLVANGTNIQWYSTISSTTPLATSTALVNGSTYYATQTVSGCQSTSRLAVTISIINPSAPSGTANQTFCYGATVANLTANGSNIQWYPVASGGTAAATSAILISGNTYYATQTVSGCESTNRLAVTVSVATSPVPTPAGSTSQTFCNSATVSSLVANGTNIQWFTSATGGTTLSPSTALINGTTYYANQTVNGCQSSTRLAVTVTLTNTPTPIGAASQSFCTGATLANLSANGSNIQWYSAGSGGTALSASTVLSNGVTYYATQTVNGCVSSTRLAVTVSISASSAFSEICLVSVDNNDGKNIVIWEKATNQRIEYYKIYKQNTINSQYDSIAFVPFDSFSVFKDFNSNPSQQSESYRISAVDSCGIEGPILSAHTTIHLTANQGVNNNVNLLWNAYSGFIYPNFEIYRSNNGSAYTLIGTVANSSFSFTDLTPPAGTNYYYVSVTKPVPCNPTKAAPVLKSISNILDAQGNQVISSNEPIISTNPYKIYPNPVKDQLTVEIDPSYLGIRYSIIDVLGREILNGIVHEQMTNINLQNLIPGIYFLYGQNRTIVHKLIKE
jgi:uncharacterized delta-60 repeat protein